MLKQFGIEVDEHASKETILAGILEKVANQAETYANTQKGATKVLKTYLGEAIEAIGKSYGLGDSINYVKDRVIGWVREQGGLNKVLEKYKDLISVIAGLLQGIFLTGIIVATAAIVVMMGPFGLILATGVALGAWIVAFALNWAFHWENIKMAFWKVADWLCEKFNWLRKKFDETLGWISDKLRGFVDTLENIEKKITSPFKEAGEKVGGIIKRIPGFQFGGIVTRPTLAMVGEAGPEAIIPLRRERGFGGNIIINLSGTFYTEEEVAEKWANHIAKLIKYQLRI
jgi:hypothetical protein